MPSRPRCVHLPPGNGVPTPIRPWRRRRLAPARPRIQAMLSIIQTYGYSFSDWETIRLAPVRGLSWHQSRINGMLGGTRLDIPRKIRLAVCQAAGSQVVFGHKTQQCNRCLQGRGPWKQCIVLKIGGLGRENWSCMNCLFDNEQRDCTFARSQNKPRKPALLLQIMSRLIICRCGIQCCSKQSFAPKS